MRRRADYLLSYRPNQPLAVIEARDNRHAPGDGMKQALWYAEELDVPFAFSSNGDRFLFDDLTVDRSYEIYLSLYQAVSGTEDEQNVYRQFSADFFDLMVIDECHRGSAAIDSAWRAILEYFSSATHIGLTAMPKETREVSNIDYFGEPVYTYSLKQDIEDGFLSPYKVVRVDLDRDLQGRPPTRGQTDKYGEPIPDRIYNQKDFDRELILEQRTELVADTVSELLEGSDPFQKTIVFCEDIDHAEYSKRSFGG